MADTFPARATSPAASNPSSAQMTAAESENAPLLSQDAAQAENTAPDADPEANTHPSDSAPLPSEKHMVILTLLSFALSLISLTFVAAAYIFVHAAPFDIHFFRGVDVSVQIVVPFVRRQNSLSIPIPTSIPSTLLIHPSRPSWPPSSPSPTSSASAFAACFYQWSSTSSSTS